MRATLLAIRDELKRGRYEPIQVQGQWLARAQRGYFNYHAVPGSQIRLVGFRFSVFGWRYAVYGGNRSSVAASVIGFKLRYGRLVDLYIPSPRNAHPYPEDRFALYTRGRSRMR
jgi:RNA-directed DNA polymerase